MNAPIYIPESPPPPQPIPSESPETVFCFLCLRERPPGGEFYACGSGTTSGAEFRESIKNNVGLELSGEEEFDICTPCWKMVHLMEDFRLCCFKAQERLLGSSGARRGMKGTTEDWFQEEVVEAIDSLRSIIQQQVMEIEGDEGDSEDGMQVESVLDEEGQSLAFEQVDEVEANGDLVTQISVGDFKIEVFDDDVQEVECSTQSNIAVEPPEDHPDELKCAKCSLCFENKQDFRDHTQYCKAKAMNSSQESNIHHSCMRCLTSFKHHHLLEHHMNKEHGIKPYDCESNCRKNQNIPAATKTNSSNSKTGVVCKVCNAVLANPGSLRSHTVVTHGQRKFPCGYCSRKFTRMYELKRHNRVVHSVELVSPPRLIKDLQSKTSDLSKHLGAASSSSSSPSQQVINLVDDQAPCPTGKSVHQCPTCGKTFARYHKLLEHVQQWHSHLVQEFIAAWRKMYQREECVVIE